MVSRRLHVVLIAAACVFTMTSRPSLGGEPGYDVWFAGRVISVDAQRGRLRIARGPTETAGAGVEECLVTSANLKLVRPGMQIVAQADTRRRPWRVLHLRVMELKTTRPRDATPVIAST